MTLNIKASFPQGEIYNSGVILFRDLEKKLTLSITPAEISNASTYHVYIKISHIEGQDSTAKWTGSSDGGFNLEIVNFDSPYGLTLHNPVIIGSYNGRQVLLDFVVYRLGNYTTSPRMFCYTLRSGDLINE
jgi:hypothetical protein